MRCIGDRSRVLLAPAILAAGFSVSMGAVAQPGIPDNLGGGLRQLVEALRRTSATVSAAPLMEPRLLRDAQSRVLVNVWLGRGYSIEDGYGLIDAYAAYQRLTRSATITK